MVLSIFLVVEGERKFEADGFDFSGCVDVASPIFVYACKVCSCLRVGQNSTTTNMHCCRLGNIEGIVGTLRPHQLNIIGSSKSAI